jgi:hypothetical protein
MLTVANKICLDNGGSSAANPKLAMLHHAVDEHAADQIIPAQPRSHMPWRSRDETLDQPILFLRSRRKKKKNRIAKMLHPPAP